MDIERQPVMCKRSDEKYRQESGMLEPCFKQSDWRIFWLLVNCLNHTENNIPWRQKRQTLLKYGATFVYGIIMPLRFSSSGETWATIEHTSWIGFSMPCSYIWITWRCRLLWNRHWTSRSCRAPHKLLTWRWAENKSHIDETQSQKNGISQIYLIVIVSSQKPKSISKASMGWCMLMVIVGCQWQMVNSS